MTGAIPANRSVVEEMADYLVPNANATPVIVQGQGAEVEDVDGRRYLDLEAGPGVASVGHCHPRIVAAIREQAGKLLQSPGRFHSEITLKLARRIAALLQERLKRIFFSNSGAEANDGAIKVAMKHATATGKRGFGIIALEHGFHGRLCLPLALTGMAGRKKGFGPYGTFPGVVHVPAPYCYRCPLGLKRATCGTRCADALEETLKTAVPGEAAVLIAEPILGVGGVIVPPDDYWPRIEDICRRHSITLIHDEVFTGFGRTGKIFAHEHWNTKPDMVTFAKAIGGGIPLGGLAATEEIGQALDAGDHFTTFGSNNQVGMAAAHAVLDVLRDESLADKAAARGDQFMTGLRELAERHTQIGDVRGKGLMIGVEIVDDRQTKAPGAARAKRIQAALREDAILIAVTGVNGCVLRITPPLVITEAQISRALEAFERAFIEEGRA